jgi:hypothetical protein
MGKRKGEPSRTVLDAQFPHQISIPDEWFKGSDYVAVRLHADSLSVATRTHSYCHQDRWHTVFRFREKADAEAFQKKFGGEWFDPSRRGRGGRWHLLRDKKGRYNPLKEFFQFPVSWQKKLSRPVGHSKPKRGELLTLADARSYMLDFTGGREKREYWQCAIKLLVEAADNGDVEEATNQLELALMMDGVLVMKGPIR